MASDILLKTGDIISKIILSFYVCMLIADGCCEWWGRVLIHQKIINVWHIEHWCAKRSSTFCRAFLLVLFSPINILQEPAAAGGSNKSYYAQQIHSIYSLMMFTSEVTQYSWYMKESSIARLFIFLWKSRVLKTKSKRASCSCNMHSFA